jgi:hypothetical protein
MEYRSGTTTSAQQCGGLVVGRRSDASESSPKKRVIFSASPICTTRHERRRTRTWRLVHAIANAWGFYSTQLYPGHITSEHVCQDTNGLGRTTKGASILRCPNEVDLSELPTSANQGYKIGDGETVRYPNGEYLLVEYRQHVGLNTLIPKRGLAIYHVDQNVHYYAIEAYPGEADSRYQVRIMILSS